MVWHSPIADWTAAASPSPLHQCERAPEHLVKKTLLTRRSSLSGSWGTGSAAPLLINSRSSSMLMLLMSSSPRVGASWGLSPSPPGGTSDPSVQFHTWLTCLKTLNRNWTGGFSLKILFHGYVQKIYLSFLHRAGHITLSNRYIADRYLANLHLNSEVVN